MFVHAISLALSSPPPLPVIPHPEWMHIILFLYLRAGHMTPLALSLLSPLSGESKQLPSECVTCRDKYKLTTRQADHSTTISISITSILIIPTHPHPLGGAHVGKKQEARREERDEREKESKTEYHRAWVSEWSVTR